MGKKRIIKKSSSGVNQGLRTRALSNSLKKKVLEGILHIRATYNNTLFNLTDTSGNSLVWSSAGSLGFKGARKSTPYAASKVSELIAEQAKTMNMQKLGIMVKGIGPGRESAIRSFASKGFDVLYVKDMTPMPHNGPRPPKPRRV